VCHELPSTPARIDLPNYYIIIPPIRAPPSQKQQCSLPQRYRRLTSQPAPHTAANTTAGSRHNQHRTPQPTLPQAHITASTAHRSQHYRRLTSQPAPHTAANITAGSITASTAHRRSEQFNNASAPCNAGPVLIHPDRWKAPSGGQLFSLNEFLFLP
jgi:hypothetical protein